MTKERKSTVNDTAEKEEAAKPADSEQITEHGGRDGPDPARYGDWEVGGKCVDF